MDRAVPIAALLFAAVVAVLVLTSGSPTANQRPPDPEITTLEITPPRL